MTYADNGFAVPPGYPDQPPSDEWAVLSLGRLIDEGVLWIKNGYADGSHNDNHRGVIHLRPFNISSSGEIDLTQVKSVQAPSTDSPFWLRPHDVIFNNTNSEELVGKTAFFRVQRDCVLSNHMTIVRVVRSALLDSEWLAFAFQQMWLAGEFRALCRRHVNQASVGLDRLRSVEFGLPPFEEQRAIAAVLRTVHRAKEACKQVIAVTGQLKQSFLHHLFTYGVVPFDQEDKVLLKQTELGSQPEQWPIAPIGSFCATQTGGTPSRKRACITDPAIGG